ncbi:MAG: hypothetical protein LBG58_13400 [Planctomycetaceae bacterium]|jgi:hypothetical protein|nr:hypothetical protein [Planctomycetaceae bacterium]
MNRKNIILRKLFEEFPKIKNAQPDNYEDKWVLVTGHQYHHGQQEYSNRLMDEYNDLK